MFQPSPFNSAGGRPRARGRATFKKNSSPRPPHPARLDHNGLRPVLLRDDSAYLKRESSLSPSRAFRSANLEGHSPSDHCSRFDFVRCASSTLSTWGDLCRERANFTGLALDCNEADFCMESSRRDLHDALRPATLESQFFQFAEMLFEYYKYYQHQNEIPAEIRRNLAGIRRIFPNVDEIFTHKVRNIRKIP